MEGAVETLPKVEAIDDELRLARFSRHQPRVKVYSSSWLDMRVFYVRISNFQVDSSTPEFLMLNHIPLSPDTLFEVNGVRSSSHSEGVSSSLRRDRADKKSEEATFVTTDSIRLSGNVKFEVYDKDDLILSGVLEMSNCNGLSGESKGNAKRWNMSCESKLGAGFLKGKHMIGVETPMPKIEVYVAGSFLGNPIILTRTLQLSSRKKQGWKSMLDAIPESETPKSNEDQFPQHDLQATEYIRYKQDDIEDDYYNMYWKRREYLDNEDGELSWFNAGVRVGVGIGLGVCLGIGVGVGLLVRTYRATTRNFSRRLM
ncbi:uncharacterized protein At1g01500-like [Momordica charantia]|uniref:Uncharacterized protein At1g01500-like n=1 Tax=Momordica charantia TaxID=3673 RepID=A0A6J1DEH6_MOMCH|nr:uncharacterized protein At1g01500-like [Momordica charantia]XP_022152297.1 uncharacterized protein At1g01500-like [Momordica charantia]XP_022152298.1 uncharacterized protein At1g01500-like [Momordica charantia]XP_022152299.1 uncharacterized protein At1g01500-like [Momordica charantia]XP_022152300.1 uncharacterized protein At1g01500-like [Momordica charantia]